MANLLIEIGNTAVKAAWSEASMLGKTFRYQGEKVLDFIVSLTEKQMPQVMAVVSVRDITPDEESTLRGACQSLLLMDNSHTDALEDLGMPSYLTPDRACSLVAARHMFEGKACTLFDFGTTLTVDFMDAGGHYLGGNVSLGCRTRFKALNRYSRALPLVDMPSSIAFPGESLRGSIESGIISGIIFEIDGYIRSNPDNILIFTGGDANYFAKMIKNSIFVVSNLGLMGLAAITEGYVNENI